MSVQHGHNRQCLLKSWLLSLRISMLLQCPNTFLPHTYFVEHAVSSQARKRARQNPASIPFMRNTIEWTLLYVRHSYCFIFVVTAAAVVKHSESLGPISRFLTGVTHPIVMSIVWCTYRSTFFVGVIRCTVPFCASRSSFLLVSSSRPPWFVSRMCDREKVQLHGQGGVCSRRSDGETARRRCQARQVWREAYAARRLPEVTDGDTLC